MAKVKSNTGITYKSKPKKKNKGIHSKNNKPKKTYKGQGR